MESTLILRLDFRGVKIRLYFPLVPEREADSKPRYNPASCIKLSTCPRYETLGGIGDQFCLISITFLPVKLSLPRNWYPGMYLTLEERAQELQEAFIRHVRHLQGDYERQLSQLPRSGKAVESTVDISREQRYTSRVAFFESCIQNTTLIASKVSEAINGLGGDKSSSSSLIDLGRPQGLVQEIDAFAPDDDTPYMNPFTGKLVVPTTRFTAGPSGSQNPFSNSRQISTGQTSKVRTPIVYPKIQPPAPAPALFTKRNPLLDEQPVRTMLASPQATAKRNEDHTGFIDSMMPPKVAISIILNPDEQTNVL